MLPIHVITHGPDETRAVAAQIAPALKPGMVLALHGDLGSGKTCFIQGLAAALGVTANVNSPTYTIISEYAGRMPFYHVDLYRLDDAREALKAGLDDYLQGDGITAIEWAERVAGLLPPDTIHVYLHAGDGANERLVEIREPARPGETDAP